MIVNRFQWLNRIPATGLLPTWNDGAQEDIFFDFDLRIALPFVPELNERLGVDRSTLDLAVLAIETESVVRALCASVLRFCPSCLALGLHATIHQCRLITVCPVHQHRLRARCPYCRTPIAYRFDALAAAHPNACPHCFSQLIGEPMRSASRRDPLSVAQRTQFIAIQQWVEHHGNCLSLAARPVGVSADVHTKPLRSRLLFLRRLVSPLDEQSALSPLEYRAAARRLARRWLTRQTHASQIGILRYSRRQWPHFDGIYLRLESDYRGAIANLQNQIGNNQRMSSSRAVSLCELASTLFRMAWEGVQQSHLLDGANHPAFGIAVWLALFDRPSAESAALMQSTRTQFFEALVTVLASAIMWAHRLREAHSAMPPGRLLLPEIFAVSRSQRFANRNS